MPVNGDGEKEAVPVYLSFFYRCATKGTLRVQFLDVDKTGFANFNSLEVEEELSATDGYVQYTCSGLWNGTGDFKLSFTGDIYLYMLVLSTDKVESLAHRYRTLFEQSERLVKITAAVFDRDENMLEETGLVVKPEGAGIYAQDADGKLALIGVSVDGTDADGNKISVVKLTGDRVKLEGLVTANDNFKILEDGEHRGERGHVLRAYPHELPPCGVERRRPDLLLGPRRGRLPDRPRAEPEGGHGRFVERCGHHPSERRALYRLARNPLQRLPPSLYAYGGLYPLQLRPCGRRHAAPRFQREP